MNYQKKFMEVYLHDGFLTEGQLADKLLYRSSPTPEFMEVYLHSHKTSMGYLCGIRFRFYGKKRPKNAWRQVIDFFLPIGNKMCELFETLDAIIQEDPFEAYCRREVRFMLGKNRNLFWERSEDATHLLIRKQIYTWYQEEMNRSGACGDLWTGYSQYKSTPYENVKEERLTISHVPMRRGEKSRKPWYLYIYKERQGPRVRERAKEGQSKLFKQMDHDKCELYLSTDQIAEMTEKIFAAVMELRRSTV